MYYRVDVMIMQTSQNIKKLKDFMTELENWFQQNDEILKIEFFGSAINRQNEWVKGKSDIDVVVFGSDISGETKRLAHKMFWELNSKYELELEDVAALHPLIFFIDSPERQLAYTIIKPLKFDSPEFRKLLKMILPKWKDIKKLSYLLPNPLWKFA